jgi:phage gp36-like protein
LSAYCTQSDIEGEIQNSDLIAITDDANQGSINTTVLNQVIANASGEIDRLVGNVYDVPFNPAPPSVQSMAIIIACYRLYRRRLTPDEKNLFWPGYKEVIAFLNKVHKREDVLDLSVTADYSQVQADVRGTIFSPAGGNYLSNSM